MKKLTILSGPGASGKSHIGQAIEMQHNDIWKANARSVIAKKSVLYTLPFIPTLIVVFEIQKRQIEPAYKLISENYPNANIVMQTQNDIDAKDYDYAHVINCRNVVI